MRHKKILILSAFGADILANCWWFQSWPFVRV